MYNEFGHADLLDNQIFMFCHATVFYNYFITMEVLTELTHASRRRSKNTITNIEIV